jgi:hypothetical protein
MNVNGRDRVLNPGPLSRRPDKSTTTPRSESLILVLRHFYNYHFDPP